jgi:hypothetical protein
VSDAPPCFPLHPSYGHQPLSPRARAPGAAHTELRTKTPSWPAPHGSASSGLNWLGTTHTELRTKKNK